MSGRGSEKDYENCKKEGAFDYLIKPVQIDVLIEKIKEAVLEIQN
jgi:FixJ family two-component response regulator